MARFARYLREEKYITTQDAAGIRKRWEYGRRLLMDDRAMSASKKSLQPRVMETLIGNATASGYKLSASEVRYRLQCARTYETEAQITKILGDFENWWSLIQAGFPQVEVSDPGEPHDPRDADEKSRDARAAIERRKAQRPDQAALFDWNPPHQFRGDEHGPRSTVKELYAVCDESERYTAGMIAYDARRRAYVDECAAAVGGDLDKTWYEAEKRRNGLEALGLADWDDLTEIMEDFFGLHDSASSAPDDDGDGDGEDGE